MNNKQTINRWTRALWSGAALCWIVVLFTLLALSMAQGCNTFKAAGRLVQAVGEDMEGAATGIEKNIAERN